MQNGNSLFKHNPLSCLYPFGDALNVSPLCFLAQKIAAQIDGAANVSMDEFADQCHALPQQACVGVHGSAVDVFAASASG